MDLKQYFYTIFKALNPYNYNELTENTFFKTIKYYLFIIVFCVILMTILFIPFFYSIGTHVTEGISHFNNLTVSSDFSLKESFNVVTDPLIRFEPTEKNISEEVLLITPDNMVYKKYLLFGKQQTIPITGVVDVASSPRAQMMISAGIIFLIPSLIFWGTIFSIIYFGIIIFLTFIIALTVARILKIEASPIKIIQMCTYSATIFIIIQLLFMPFFRLFLIPLIAYWLLIIIILFLWQDDMYKRHKERDSEDYKPSHGSKTKEIFGSKDESVFKTKSHTPKQDTYDVDENGNLKGSSKKHKHLDDDEEGYVEWK